ncbi:MAG: hypothetical protein WC667_02260 [Sulfurimonas sp.]|jgi:hypothetical protein
MFDIINKLLYPTVFVNIIVKHSTTAVYIEIIKNKVVIDSAQKSFETTAVDEEMYEFITSYTRESPFYYISLLDPSEEQGAVPTCSKNSIWNFSDLSNSEHICFNNKWTYYSSKYDLLNLEKKYVTIGLDFLFSPFIVLHNFFIDKINTHKAMYVLIEESYMSLTIFDNSELLFAQHIDVENYKQSDELSMEDHSVLEEEMEEMEETIDLDDLDALEELDDFGDIEDLDTLEEMDDFAQTHDLEEELKQDEEIKLLERESENFNEDYQRFLLIQSAIKYFYKDDKFNSEFIETIYIADSIKVSRDLKKYLEEEMFLSVYIRHMDLVKEICETAKLELQ